jgi:transcriptional regulator NrdR family protein
MRCTRCKRSGTRVLDSVERADGVRKRRRRCSACRHRFTTLEVAAEEPSPTERAPTLGRHDEDGLG